MKEWISIVKRKRSPFINYFYFKGLAKLYIDIKNFDYRYKDDWIYIEDEYFLEKQRFNDIETQILTNLKENPHFLLDITKRAYEEIKEYEKFWKKIRNDKGITKYSNEELAKLLDDYVMTMLKWNAYLHFPNIAEGIITDRLESNLHELVKDKKKFREVFITLTTPTKKSFALEENIALLSIVKKIQKSPELVALFKGTMKKEELPKEIATAIKAYLEEYSWLSNVGFWNMFSSTDDIIIKIKDALKLNAAKRLEKIENDFKNNEKQFNTTIKALNIDKELHTIIKTVQEYVYFRSFRMEIMYKSGYYITELLTEIAQRVGTTKKDIVYFLPNEISNYLNENIKANQDLVKERKKEFGMENENYAVKIYAGKTLTAFKEKYSMEVKEELKEVTGACSCPGKAEGTIKIVLDTKDLEKVKEGDVLVTTMTTPNFVPAMKRASAIITDEGGILCHAAIISRELGMPCLTGTNHATKLLKDGWFVRVDASHGLVRILKK